MNIYAGKDLFLPNKYTRWYYAIIEKAKSQDRKKLKRTNPEFIYYEAHHILPKSIFPEYVKEKWNLVLLTAREHFIVHALLCKMVTYNTNEYHKLICAFRYFTLKKNDLCISFHINSRLFEYFRKEYNKINSISQIGKHMGIKNGMYGKTHTPETVKIIKEKLNNYFKSDYYQNVVKIEIGRKNKERQTGKKRPEHAEKLRGRKHKNSTKEKMREKALSRSKEYVFWNNGFIMTTLIQCPGEGWVRGILPKNKF